MAWSQRSGRAAREAAGRAVPGCAGSASSWAKPQPQSTRITLDLCRFSHQNREGGRFNLPFPCQSSLAFRPSSESLSTTERADWSGSSAAALGQGWSGSDDPELGSGCGWPETGWIRGWAAHRRFAGQGAQPRQGMSPSGCAWISQHSPKLGLLWPPVIPPQPAGCTPSLPV